MDTVGASEQGVTVGRWVVIPRSLCLITHRRDMLLMKRAAHKRAFPGRYNGIGGHIERDEDPLAGARREIEEETGLGRDQIANLRLRGVTNVDPGGGTGIVLFVFTGEATTREVRAEGAEGTLHWMALDQLLRPDTDLPLVEDLPILLARLFGTGAEADDALFFAHVRYDEADRMVMTFA
jgi:8-oxo-dGTP diphosphatase